MPGGVGPMTRAMLQTNVVAAAERRWRRPVPDAARRADPAGGSSRRFPTTGRSAVRRSWRPHCWCSRCGLVAVVTVRRGATVLARALLLTAVLRLLLPAGATRPAGDPLDGRSTCVFCVALGGADLWLVLIE